MFELLHCAEFGTFFIKGGVHVDFPTELDLIMAAANYFKKNAEIEEIEAADDEEKVLANPEEHELIITASCLEDNTAAGDSVFGLDEEEGILYDFLKHSPEMLQLLHCASGYGEYPEEFKHEEFVDESELLGLIEAAYAEINLHEENPS